MSERRKTIAYLRGMADELDRRGGLPNRIGAEALRGASNRIAMGDHEEADELFPEHMPPRDRVVQLDRETN